MFLKLRQSSFSFLLQTVLMIQFIEPKLYAYFKKIKMLAHSGCNLQISCLRTEQTQLNRSLEKERQRAAENRQEYLAAKEIADTNEGRVNQLEEEIKQLKRKHKNDLQESLTHRELLQQVGVVYDLSYILFVLSRAYTFMDNLGVRTGKSSKTRIAKGCAYTVFFFVRSKPKFEEQIHTRKWYATELPIKILLLFFLLLLHSYYCCRTVNS